MLLRLCDEEHRAQRALLHRSTYRWQGAVTTDDEELLLIKTTAARFDALKARLLELHPYELPELVAVPLERGHEAYLAWVDALVRD